MGNGLIGLLQRHLPRFKLLAKLRKAWGAPGDTDSWRASAYFDLTRSTASAQLIDDKTWIDLEFPKIFSQFDTNISAIGRQYLFKQMRTIEFDAEMLSKRQEAYEVLRTNEALRENLQLSLARLDLDSAANIVDLLHGSPPARPRHHALVFPLGPSYVVYDCRSYRTLDPTVALREHSRDQRGRNVYILADAE